MINRDDEPRGSMTWTALAGLGLQLVPLPALIAPARPAFAVLAVVYWSLLAPRAGGIALGFLCGLALDVFRGAVLGQYALATALVAYVTIRQHLLVRNKPIFEQTLFVAAVLLAWEIVAWAIDGWTGQARGGWSRWLHVLTGALCWPLLAAMLGRTHSPR
jgi:rod shape-determining protein MreD